MLTSDHRQMPLDRFGRATRVAAAAAGFSLLALGCSADDADTVYPDDTVFGEADITVDDVEVEDGTEGGLVLDNGNVEGSSADQELDPYDEENDLNTEIPE